MSLVRVACSGLLLGLAVLNGCGDGDESSAMHANEPAPSAAAADADAGDDPSDAKAADAGSGARAGEDAGDGADDATGPTVGALKSCKASYYETGTRTANGERFDPDGLTAAHRTLPFDTMVRVINPANGKSVDVRINDRGPFGSSTRCLDLARGAFAKIAPLSAGVVQVSYGVLED